MKYIGIAIGCILMSSAMKYGAHIHFGWWSIMFWFGLGILLAAFNDD